MLARVLSCAVIGLDGDLVEVEVDIGRAMEPRMTVVGLPDAAVQESRERVRAALKNSGFSMPHPSRVTISLSPADLRKEGPAYDLPIAVGMLVAAGHLPDEMESTVLIGELALSGELRGVRGVLPMVAVARRRGVGRAFVPLQNAGEAALVDGIAVYGVSTLRELAAHLSGRTKLPLAAPACVAEIRGPVAGTDFADVLGQEHAKRALEVAAAGGHNLIMRGPPGSGKTLLARAIPSILPPMTGVEAMDVTRIYSVAGLLPAGGGLVRTRPFRAPHHTVSNAGLIGGGSVPRPGEVTLAHRGVLFLDELLEFDPHVLEVLRQPLEDRTVTISRARLAATFPANFSLVGSLNPCPCGYLGDTQRDCACSASAIARYQRRLSGPLLDRIDIYIDVPRIPYEKLVGNAASESSEDVRARVQAARERQHARFAAAGGPEQRLNADMSPSEVRDHALEHIASETRALLKTAVDRLDLSARAFHRVLKVARTIADLAGSDGIETAHVGEAIQYRARFD